MSKDYLAVACDECNAPAGDKCLVICSSYDKEEEGNDE
jgi:hypothetical protein